MTKYERNDENDLLCDICKNVSSCETLHACYFYKDFVESKMDWDRLEGSD